MIAGFLNHQRMWTFFYRITDRKVFEEGTSWDRWSSCSRRIHGFCLCWISKSRFRVHVPSTQFCMIEPVGKHYQLYCRSMSFIWLRVTIWRPGVLVQDHKEEMLAVIWSFFTPKSVIKSSFWSIFDLIAVWTTQHTKMHKVGVSSILVTSFVTLR